MEYGDITIQDEAVRLPSNYVGLVSYDVSLTTALAVTGVGFKPSSIIIFGAIANTSAWCVTLMDDTTRGGFGSYAVEAADRVNPTGQHTIVTASSQEAYLNFTSFDSDGFTLARSKAGSPTGTQSFRFMAFK